MGVTRWLKKMSNVPGVLKARHLAEVTVTPHVRGEIAEARAEARRAIDELREVSQRSADLLDHLRRQTADLEFHQPLVLNAISSTHGVARQLARAVSTERDRITAVEQQLPRVDGLEAQLPRIDRLEAWVQDHAADADNLIRLWRTDLAPHVRSLEWLLQRVEMVRAEVLNEVRYAAGASSGTAVALDAIEPRVVTEGILDTEDVKLNLGSGHVPLDGYANVDMRELPGVDVVARLDDLPVADGSVAEIFSSHVLEHFPREALGRSLLPYWFRLLRPGGVFRAVVPDLEAMTSGYASGAIPFRDFREVVYGGQEYEGDTHFTGFTPDDLVAFLGEAGFEQAEVVAQGRVNGICLELEIRAVKPID